MVDDADDVAEGFGVPQMVNRFVDVFGPRPRLRLRPRPRPRPRPRRHRLGYFLDARLTDRTAGGVYPRLGLRPRLCYVAVLGGYQQSQ